MNQQSSPAPAINPYAPSDTTGAKPLPTKASGVTGGKVLGKTILFVSLSGGVFGGLLGGTAGMAAFLSTVGSTDAVGGFLALLVMGALVGTIAAFVASLPVVGLMYLIFGAFKLGHYNFWNGRRLRTFGGLSGFFSGWSTVAVPSVLNVEFYGLYVGLIPGAVGAIATRLMIGRMARDADNEIKTAENQSLAEEALGDPLSTDSDDVSGGVF